MLVRKHLVSPGRYWYVNRDTGMPACLDATPDRIRQWCDNGNAMLSSGLSIPVPVEHKTPEEPGAGPMTESQKRAAQLRNNAGWAKKFEMEGDALFSVLDIQDESILPKLPKTIRWTSPWITSFMDGAGKVWNEAIGHIALTSQPRISKQLPFPTVEAAMSYAGSAPPTAKLPKAGATLSLAGRLEQNAGVYRPCSPVAFSLWSGGVMLAADMEDPKVDPKPEAKPKEGDKPPGAKAEGETPATPQVGPDGQPVPEALVDPDGDISVEDVIADLLSIIGIEMGEGVTPENFREHLYRALMDKHKADSGMKPPDAQMGKPTNQPNEPPMNDLPPNQTVAPVVQESQPMYMSIEQMQQAIDQHEDPQTKQVLSAMLSMQQASNAKAAALEKNAMDHARTARQARIDRLVKRAKNQQFADQINSVAAGAAFSLGDDGVVKDTMAPYLDMMEAGIRDIPAMLSVPGVQARMEPHPADTTEGMSSERASQIANEQLKNSGIQPATAPAA